MNRLETEENNQSHKVSAKHGVRGEAPASDTGGLSSSEMNSEGSDTSPDDSTGACSTEGVASRSRGPGLITGGIRSCTVWQVLVAPGVFQCGPPLVGDWQGRRVTWPGTSHHWTRVPLDGTCTTQEDVMG